MAKPANVGFVVPKLDHGGPEVWLQTLLRFLPREAAVPRVVITAPGGPVTPRMREEVWRHCPVIEWDGGGEFPSARRAQADALLGGCDVVVTWGPPFEDFRGDPGPFPGDGRPPRRVVFLAHGLAPADGVPGKERFATHYAAVCAPAAGFFLPENRDRVTVIENGVDLERISPRLGRERARHKLGCYLRDTCLVGWAGRLSDEKDPLLLARVADPKVHRGDFRFVFAGTGAEQLQYDLGNRLRNYVTPETRWVGHVDRIGDFLEALDVLVITSRTEACPLVLLEAFAAGVPVISTGYPFLDELEARYGSLAYRITPKAPEESLIEALFRSRWHLDRDLAKARELVRQQFNASRFGWRWGDYLQRVACGERPVDVA